MGYENSIACKKLDIHCCCCGKELVDSISTELGIGPDCRKEYTGGITPAVQRECNVLTHRAAIASTEGRVEEVRDLAQKIADLGLTTLADRIRERFVNAEKNVKIVLVSVDGGAALAVTTPFRRGAKDAFIAAWRKIPGRRYRNGANIVPVAEKRMLWELLKEFFPGIYGKGPDGKVFRVPQPPKQDEAKEAA
jgi:hypothetical protein